jgi:hypothetical protein
VIWTVNHVQIPRHRIIHWFGGVIPSPEA